MTVSQSEGTRGVRRVRSRAGAKRVRAIGRAGAALIVPAAGATLGTIAWSSGVAGAAVGDSNCPHGSNAGSTACFYGQVNLGVATNFTNQAENAPVGYHVNNSIWDYSGSPCNLWIEEGLTRGFLNDPTYRWYVAWNSSNGYQQYEEAPQSVDGSSHLYQINYQGNGDFNDTIDGNDLAFVTGLGAGACIGQTGLETTGFGTQFSANTFNHTPLKYEDSSGTWHQGWATSKYWIDNPCGQQGYAPPNCLNGVFNGNNEWSDNQPG